jgi:hypothetical protein
MKHSLPLKRFEYCIPGRGEAADGMKIRGNRVFGLHFQLANVSIDFENNNLSLDGDVGLILDGSRKTRPARSASARESIRVRANIYPGFSGGLAGSKEDELVYSLEGIIEDGKNINTCSGLLVLDNLTNRHEQEGKEWHATLYLYDDNGDGREIKLRLTMYCLSANAELN